MGGEAPETCWATHKHQVINLWNCCILLVDLFGRNIRMSEQMVVQKKTERLSYSTLSSGMCIKKGMTHVSRTCSRCWLAGWLAGCERYSICLAAVSSLSLTVFRRQPLGSSAVSPLTNAILRHGSTCHGFHLQGFMASATWPVFVLQVQNDAKVKWQLSLHVDVFDNGASHGERPTFLGCTCVQNGWFWCVRNEELRNTAYSFPIFASYVLVTTGRFFKNEIVIANFIKRFLTINFWGSKLDKNYKTSVNFYAHFQCYKLNTSIL
jgi:hypothetical protein